jgi:hypothetical protein
MALKMAITSAIEGRIPGRNKRFINKVETVSSIMRRFFLFIFWLGSEWWNCFHPRLPKGTGMLLSKDVYLKNLTFLFERR